MADLSQTVQAVSLSAAGILEKTQAIYEAALRESPNLRDGNFNRISSADIAFLFEQYDTHFFEGAVQASLRENPGTSIRFRPSGRLTQAAGQTRRLGRRCQAGPPTQGPIVYEIAIAADMLFQAFNQDHRPVAVNGLPCTDRLQAMQRIFEHELIHLVELIAWGNSSCRGERFHALAQRIFGHTERTHRLITRREIACNHYGLHVGDRVRFNFEGQELTGILNRITKRATVLVEREGGMRYSDGKHYAKFYVPISLLRRLG